MYRIGLTLLRSFLDVFVDFSLLIKDWNYIDNIVLEDLNNEKKYYTYLLNPNTIKPKNLQNEMSRENIIKLEDIEKKICELRNKGIKKMQIRDKYNAINLIDFYDSFYNWLSSQTHTQLSVLDERHIIEKDKNKVEVRYAQEVTDNDLKAILPIFCDTYLNALEMLTNKLKIISCNADISKNRELLNNALDASK